MGTIAIGSRGRMPAGAAWSALHHDHGSTADSVIFVRHISPAFGGTSIELTNSTVASTFGCLSLSVYCEYRIIWLSASGLTFGSTNPAFPA